jgi:hypothetical protein
MSDHFGHMEVVAIRKSGIPGWEPYLYERIGNDGVLMTGSVPRLLKSGPRKAKKTWDRKDGKKVIVTHAEMDAEKADYIVRTGNCGECFGLGQVTVGWSAKDGKKIAQCKVCNGTGKIAK